MRITFLIAFLAFVVACGDPPASEYPTQEVHAEDATMGAGDTFQVRVYRHEDMTGDYEVSSEGTISFLSLIHI